MQRQDVPIFADTFQGNMQQQTHERFSLGSDCASAQAATRRQTAKNTDVFMQQYPVSGPLQTSSTDLDHRPRIAIQGQWLQKECYRC